MASRGQNLSPVERRTRASGTQVEREMRELARATPLASPRALGVASRRTFGAAGGRGLGVARGTRRDAGQFAAFRVIDSVGVCYQFLGDMVPTEQSWVGALGSEMQQYSRNPVCNQRAPVGVHVAEAMDTLRCVPCRGRVGNGTSGF